MTCRTFLFCDVCNPAGIRVVELRRDMNRDKNDGRRISDGRAWFEGTPEEAAGAGWRVLKDGRHLCPRCLRRHHEDELA